jgi:hypothetical protein
VKAQSIANCRVASVLSLTLGSLTLGWTMIVLPRVLSASIASKLQLGGISVGILVLVPMALSLTSTLLFAKFSSGSAGFKNGRMSVPLYRAFNWWMLGGSGVGIFWSAFCIAVGKSPSSTYYVAAAAFLYMALTSGRKLAKLPSISPQ